jgi:hypothetical protein
MARILIFGVLVYLAWQLYKRYNVRRSAAIQAADAKPKDYKPSTDISDVRPTFDEKMAEIRARQQAGEQPIAPTGTEPSTPA